MPECIFCRVDKPVESFNREHVLPKSFGTFKGSPVLREVVCEECNTHFGRTLDLALARSSSEGLERYAWRIKPSEDVGRFRYGDVVIRLDAPETEWHHALVRKIPGGDAGDTVIELIPQAIFTQKDGVGVVHVPLWDLQSGKWRSDDTVDTSKGIRVLALADEYDLVKDALRAQGIAWREEGELPAPPSGPGEEATVHHEFRVSDELRRAIAKLAFNYFAYAFGREAALDPTFDALRAYIRFGTSPELHPVRLVKHSRLGIQKPDGTVPVVHYLTLERDRSGAALLAHVTLFHWAVYMVVLTPTCPASLADVGRGHLFNIADRTCHELRLQRKPLS